MSKRKRGTSGRELAGEDLPLAALARVREVAQLPTTTRAEAKEAWRQMVALHREAEGDWRIAAAILEVRYPDRWGGPADRRRRA